MMIESFGLGAIGDDVMETYFYYVEDKETGNGIFSKFGIEIVWVCLGVI